VALKAIAFDIDGTLYPDLGLRRRLIPFTLRHSPFLLAFSRASAILHAEAAQERPGPADLASFRLHQAELVAASLGVSRERAFALAERIVYEELEAFFVKVELYPGVQACLETLAAAGFSLGALSDFPAQAKLGHLGLSGLIPLAMTSEASGRLKPSPKPFLDLAAALGQPPESILYVGNSVRYDVRGAKAAGMRTALRIARGGPAATGHAFLMRGADLVFSDWGDLAPLILGDPHSHQKSSIR